MTKTITVLMVTAALAVGCRNGEGERAGAHAGAAVEHAGHGTVNAIESAGHGVQYGVRELGQSMSGTQGNPHAESLSQQSRQRMEDEARQAGQQFDQAGHQITGQAPVNTGDQGRANPPPSARGGGPRDSNR